MKLLDKIADKLGYMRKDSVVQPKIFEQKVNIEKYRVQRVYPVDEILDAPVLEGAITKDIVRGFIDILPEVCTIYSEIDELSNNYVLTAELNVVKEETYREKVN